MPPGGGGAPPPMGGAAGTGPAMAPSGMAGGNSQGMGLVTEALKLMQKALPLLPLGSDLHNAAIKAVGDLTKHVGQGAQEAQPNAMMLQQMMRQGAQNPNAMAMQRLFGGGGAPPGGGGAPPGPGGGAPPPM